MQFPDLGGNKGWANGESESCRFLEACQSQEARTGFRKIVEQRASLVSLSLQAPGVFHRSGLRGETWRKGKLFRVSSALEAVAADATAVAGRAAAARVG